MLADDVLSVPTARAAAGDNFVYLDRGIHEAHRFDLSRDFAVAAADIAWEQGGEAVKKCSSMARLPYETTWLEFAQSHRVAHLGGSVGPTQVQVKRIGFLLQARNADHSAFDAHMFWSADGYGVAPVAMSLLVDLGDGNAAAEARQESGWHEGRDWIDSVTVPFKNPFLGAALERAKSGVGTYSERELLGSGFDDWAGELSFLISALALLNSKKTSEIKSGQGEPRRRNGRAKKLLSYSICDIRRTIKENNKQHDGHDAECRAHFVRGHFKARSTGIHWWSPFIRGNQSLGFVSKSYKVHA